MISNSSPLIIFGKLNKLDLLKKAFGKITISESVYDEVIKKGIEINAPESFLIKDHITRKNIEIKTLDKKWKEKAVFLEKAYNPLDYGESETICLALQQKEKIILIDEKIARKVAKIYGLDSIGSLGVLLLAFKKGFLEEKEIINIINEILSTNFRISGNLIQNFWEQFNEFKRREK